MFVYWKIACWNNGKTQTLPNFPFWWEVFPVLILQICSVLDLGPPEWLVSSRAHLDGLRGSVQSTLKGGCPQFGNGEDRWKDPWGASRKAPLLLPVTVAARTGSNHIYLELEDKKLVNSLESKGSCANELEGCFTSLSLGTYSLHFSKALSGHMLAFLSDFSVLQGQWLLLWVADSLSTFWNICNPISRGKTSLETFSFL